MNFRKHFIAGLLMAGMLALAPDTLFARGGGGGGGHFGGGAGHFGGGGGHFGGGGGHFGGGGHIAGFHSGFASHWGHGAGGWHHGNYYPWYNGYYGPFGYGFDAYDDAYPYYDNDYSYDVQPAPSELAPDASTSLIVSVQKELAQLGYYNGPIDGVAGSETEHAVRWFQSVDHLPVTGRIDDATLQALHIA